MSSNISRKKRVVFSVAVLLFFLVFLLVAGEIVARLKGIRPWSPTPVDVTVEPGGSLYQTDGELGYTQRPGRFRVTIKDGFHFDLTHRQGGLRVTSPLESYSEEREGEIWVFGGSFTHGWSLDDDETYPWLLQEEFPEYRVVNFGTGGYGTLHSFLQFREALLERGAPEVAIVAYAGFHDERNTFQRSRRKTVAPWNHLGPHLQPYARLQEDGGLEFSMADVVYREFPLMRVSALAHYLEMRYNRLEADRLSSHRVSRRLVSRFDDLADEHGVAFGLAGLTSRPKTRRMLEFAERRGIPAIDISLDYSLPGNTNRPYDDHPSAKANRHFADRLAPFVRSLLESKPE